MFLVVLVIATLVAALATRGAGPRSWARSGLGVALAVAGVAHLVAPGPFEQHLPAWVPAAELVVASTGLAEIVLGVALIAARRHVATIGLVTAGFLVAVWPANIYVAVAGIDVEGQPGGVYPWLRIPLQVVFVTWAWWATRPPSGERHPARSAVGSSASIDNEGRPPCGDSSTTSA